MMLFTPLLIPTAHPPDVPDVPPCPAHLGPYGCQEEVGHVCLHAHGSVMWADEWDLVSRTLLPLILGTPMDKDTQEAKVIY